MRFIYIAMVFLCVACSNNRVQKVELPDTGKPILHGISDAELRETMDRMNALMFERFMTEHELDQKRRQHSVEIASIAGQLSQTIDIILSKLPELNLNLSDQYAFKSLAEKLKSQAENLKIQADRNKIDAIPKMLESMRITCITCHQLFRQLRDQP